MTDQTVEAVWKDLCKIERLIDIELYPEAEKAASEAKGRCKVGETLGDAIGVLFDAQRRRAAQEQREREGKPPGEYDTETLRTNTLREVAANINEALCKVESPKDFDRNKLPHDERAIVAMLLNQLSICHSGLEEQDIAVGYAQAAYDLYRQEDPAGGPNLAQYACTMSLYNKGVALRHKHDEVGAIRCFSDLVGRARQGTADTPKLLDANYLPALCFWAESLRELERCGEAVSTLSAKDAEDLLNAAVADQLEPTYLRYQRARFNFIRAATQNDLGEFKKALCHLMGTESDELGVQGDEINSLSQAIGSDHLVMLAQSMLELGYIYVGLEKYDLARQAFETSASCAERGGSGRIKRTAHENTARVCWREVLRSTPEDWDSELGRRVWDEFAEALDEMRPQSDLKCLDNLRDAIHDYTRWAAGRRKDGVSNGAVSLGEKLQCRLTAIQHKHGLNLDGYRDPEGVLSEEAVKSLAAVLTLILEEAPRRGYLDLASRAMRDLTKLEARSVEFLPEEQEYIRLGVRSFCTPDHGLIEEEFLGRLRDHNKEFDRYLSGRSSHGADGKAFFVVLRRWNSFTPGLATSAEPRRGGGYFISCPPSQKDGHPTGIVVDPGFSFLENFFHEGFTAQDIDVVVVTHAHPDHCNALPTIVTLIYQINKRNDHDKKERNKAIRLVLSPGAYQQFSGYLHGWREQVSDTRVVSPDDDACLLEFPGLCLHIQRADHEDIGGNPCLGLKFKFENCTLGLTSDTRWTREVANQYADCSIVCLHLGSVVDIRLDERVSRLIDNANSGRVNKQLLAEWLDRYNHLCYPGSLLLLSQAPNARVAIISEFGEELKGGLRYDLAEKLQAVVGEKLKVLPGDIGMRVRIEDGWVWCTCCDRYVSPQKIDVVAVGHEEALCYLCEECRLGYSIYQTGDKLRTYCERGRLPKKSEEKAGP